LETRQNEFVQEARLWVSALESRTIRFTAVGIAVTFFTWSAAYGFELLNNVNVANIAAATFFFVGGLVTSISAGVQYVLYRRLPHVKRRDISRAIKTAVSVSYDPKQVWSDYFGDESEGEDAYGANIKLADYGDESSQYGWIVEHVKPQNEGGSDDYSNLRPVNIRASRPQGD